MYDAEPDSDDAPKRKLIGNAGRCPKRNSKRVYTKKRKFSANQHTKNKQQKKRKSVVSDEALEATISGKKIVSINVPKPSDNIQGYRVIDMTILDSIVSKLLCPNCQDYGINIHEDSSKRRGMSSCLTVECSKCGYSDNCYSSKTVSNVVSVQGRTSYDINVRAVYAMRRCGVGLKGITKFCGMLNMPPPITQHSYDIITKKLGTAAESIAKQSMNHAINDLKTKEGTEITVSVDGTWQKRGFSSLNGVVAAVSVSTGKVIDVEIMSRHCKACIVHESLKSRNPLDYDIWKNEHEKHCNLNYVGSAPGMEAAGAKNIFMRSESNYGVQYTTFIGDGDSKAFTEVENVYPGKKVIKYHCVGHYQKRVGNRLRKLKTRVKGLGGRTKKVPERVVDHRIVKAKVLKGRLTDSLIDTLQNYFGIALRSSHTTVPELRSALLASFFHVCSSEGRNFHTYCPKSSDSWCQYQRDQHNNTNLHKPGPGLDDDVIKEVKPIYSDLTKDQELSKCLHGQTQNANESFNATIWDRAPKANYCALSTLKLCVYDAVASYNYGGLATIDIFSYLRMEPGYFTTKMCEQMNITRKYVSAYKNMDTSKKQRKLIRGKKKKKGDKENKKEGKTYESGGF